MGVVLWDLAWLRLIWWWAYRDQPSWRRPPPAPKLLSKPRGKLGSRPARVWRDLLTWYNRDMAETRASALAKVKRAVARRAAALQRGDTKRAQTALAIARKYRAIARTLRRKPNPCRGRSIRYTSTKGWDNRPSISPTLIVLHSTESNPGSGAGVARYLASGNTQADIHVVIDNDGTKYRLVPDGRKAWHVVTFNSRTLGIEQVGRAAQGHWPDAQLHAVAKQIACWSHKYGIPIVDARRDLLRGVCTHASLGTAGGGHTDPGAAYPFGRVLALARNYR